MLIASVKKAVLAPLVALVLFVSVVSPILAVTLTSPECGKQCCRREKSCCCRKKAQSAPGISARTCPVGCGQIATAPAIRLAWAGGAVLLFLTTAVFTTPLWTATILLPSLLLCFALSQRPPPRTA